MVGPVLWKSSEVRPGCSAQIRERDRRKLSPAKVVGARVGQNTGCVRVVLFFGSSGEDSVEKTGFRYDRNLLDDREEEVVLLSH